MQECVDQIERFYKTSEELKSLLLANSKNYIATSNTAREELLHKILFLKDTIENNEGYKLLYHKDVCITNEDNLERLFRFTLDGTPFDFNFDANNGNGEYDIKASNGSSNKYIAELKLASNSRLSHIFEQTKTYEKANKCKNSLYVIFYFNNEEKLKIDTLFKKDENFKKYKDSIILIDCRKNRKSASKR